TRAAHPRPRWAVPTMTPRATWTRPATTRGRSSAAPTAATARRCRPTPRGIAASRLLARSVPTEARARERSVEGGRDRPRCRLDAVQRREGVAHDRLADRLLHARADAARDAPAHPRRVEPKQPPQDGRRRKGGGEQRQRDRQRPE